MNSRVTEARRFLTRITTTQYHNGFGINDLLSIKTQIVIVHIPLDEFVVAFGIR